MAFLDGCHQTELSGEVLESFRFRCFGEPFVHVGPFVVLSVSCGGQVLRGRADAFQLLEPKLGMLLLVVCRLLEDGRDLFETLLFRLRREVGVFVTCLALACEGGL